MVGVYSCEHSLQYVLVVPIKSLLPRLSESGGSVMSVDVAAGGCFCVWEENA